MKLRSLTAALEQFAPLPLQESYDNAGLQVGLTEEAEVSGALLCLDVTEAVVDEAVEKGCNVIVSHHPLLFRGLKTVADADLVQRCVRKAILNGVAIYSAHTNLDAVEGGVNSMMAEKLGLVHQEMLDAKTFTGSGKTVTYGTGLMGELPEAMSAEAFLKKVKQTFGVKCLMHNTMLQRPIRRVALCGGAGDFVLDAAIREGADAFLTGEMHYHVYFGHEAEIQIAVLGHYQSEFYTIALLGRILSESCPGLKIVETEIDTNPICYL